jgi:hypothetical protein
MTVGLQPAAAVSAHVWTGSALWFTLLPAEFRVASVMRWFRAFCTIVAALPYAAVACAGAPACAPEIVGPWTGHVLDGGRIKQLGTQFVLQSGELTGTYHVDDADGGFSGTLTDFTPSGACTGQFLWHDRNGTGVVRVDFRPDRGRFEGLWGDDAPLTDHIFTGYRYLPVPVS